MKKRKIVIILLGVAIIVISCIMTVHLKEICYEGVVNQGKWSLAAWTLVQIWATIYAMIISFLTLILVLINVCRKFK